MSSNTLFGLSPTPTCATPTPTTAIEREWWRKRLRYLYIRSRNHKSQSLCKNRRMNFGATAERCPSIPGLYREKSPTMSASSCSRSRPQLSTARPFMSVRSFTNGSSDRATPRQRQNLDVQLSGPRAGTPLRNLRRGDYSLVSQSAPVAFPGS